MQIVLWYVLVNHESLGAFIDGYDVSGPADVFLPEVDRLLYEYIKLILSIIFGRAEEKERTKKYNTAHPHVLEESIARQQGPNAFPNLYIYNAQ